MCSGKSFQIKCYLVPSKDYYQMSNKITQIIEKFWTYNLSCQQNIDEYFLVLYLRINCNNIMSWVVSFTRDQQDFTDTTIKAFATVLKILLQVYKTNYEDRAIAFATWVDLFKAFGSTLHALLTRNNFFNKLRDEELHFMDLYKFNIQEANDNLKTTPFKYSIY